MSESIFDMLPDGGREAKQSVAEVGAFIAAPTAVGAIVGSFIPVAGTAIGAGAGAVVGSSLFLANKIKEKLDE